MKVGNIYCILDIYYLIIYYMDQTNFVNNFLANSNQKNLVVLTRGCVAGLRQRRGMTRRLPARAR